MTKLALIFLIFGVSLLFLRKGKKERGECVVCGKDIFDPKMEDGMSFCLGHSELYKKAEWKDFKRGHASPDDPEYGVKLFEFKQSLNEKGVRSFIKAHYFQNDGEIVTEMVLMVLEEDLEKTEALSRSWEKI